MQRAGRQGWINGINNGTAAYQTGVSNAGPKYQAKMSVWLPIIDQAAQAVRQMPSGSLGASQNRASAFMAALYNAKHVQGI